MKAVQPGDQAAQIIADEQKALARVNTALSRLNTEQAGAPDYDTALINLRDQIAEAKPEDLAPLVEQMARISAIAQRYGRGRDLPVDPASPYFAHLKLYEDDRKKDVLIGKHGFIDRGQNVTIVDWRNAPVSRIYYRYAEGDDYEEAFGSRDVEGIVRARRTLTISDGKLERISCPQGLFVEDGEGAWHVAATQGAPELKGGQGKAARPPKVSAGRQGSQLGATSRIQLRADKHLPEIAALIDPTQFELITQPDSGLVILQGGAGTGKTTVALHRIAYLCYQRPKLFRPQRMLLVVPGDGMVRYLERVLPSLGVADVKVFTVRRWFERTRRRVLPSAPRKYNEDTPAAVLRFKKHPLLLKLAQEYVRRQVGEIDQSLRTRLLEQPQHEALLAKWESQTANPLCKRLQAVRDSLRQTTSLPPATRQIADTVLKQSMARARDIVTDWAEMLTDRSLMKSFVDQFPDSRFTERDIGQVCDWCARQSDDATSQPSDGDKNSDDNPYMSVDGRDERVEAVVGRLDPPDDSLLLYLALLKWGELRVAGSKKRVDYEHVVADEAQDLTAVELRVLIAVSGKQRSVTLAGDTAQRLVFDNGFDSWEALLNVIDVPVAANTTLKLGYRATAEVMDLADSFIEGANHVMQSLRRGAPVEFFRFGSQGEGVAMLAEALRSLSMREPLASLALITRYPAQARFYADALSRAEVPGVRWVQGQHFSFRPGFEVVDIAQVKGLEFDYVILLDVDQSNYPSSTECRHLLHIGATRAVHQLWLTAAGKPSALLSPALKSLTP